MASLKSRQRREIVRSGSPTENRVPSKCRTTPGDSISVAAYTTQPMARAGGRVALTAPPGSTLSIRRPVCGPGSPWKYHQGMPFWAATTAVLPCSRGCTNGPAAA